MPEIDLTAAAVAVAAPEVRAELGRSALPMTARAFLEASSATEAPKGFLELFGGGLWSGSLDQFPPWSGLPIPHDAQGRVSRAFGAWQFLPATHQRIAAMTGRSDVYPASQVANASVLAVSDFARNDGGDLWAVLAIGTDDALERVRTALVSTWPGGCNAGFAARYRLALTRIMQATSTIEIPLGMRFECPIKGSLKGSPRPVPVDALRADDAAVCAISIENGDTAIFTPSAVGRTRVLGADLTLEVAVNSPTPDHLEVDIPAGRFTALVGSMIGGATIGAALLLFALPPASSTQFRFPYGGIAENGPHAVAAIPPAASLFASSFEGASAEPPTIGDPRFCFGPDQPAFAIERCLKWTSALSRR